MKYRLSTWMISVLIFALTPVGGVLGFNDGGIYQTQVYSEITINNWVAEIGDSIYIDITNNKGVISNVTNTRWAEFPVVTGQKKYVSYIGLYYYAATPVSDWVVKTMHTKGDRYTFGDTGRFLRLWKDGENFSHYGIHAFKRGDYLLSFEDQKRYLSMGCVLVSEEVLDQLAKVFDVNAEEGIKVKTAYSA